MCDSVEFLNGHAAWTAADLEANGIPVADHLFWTAVDENRPPTAEERTKHCMCSFDTGEALEASGRIFVHLPYGYWLEKEPVQ